VPRLADVLGALLTDLIRARAAADALTADLVREYQDDPLLASFSVPRVTVSDMAVRIRFLVTEVELGERPPLDVERFGRAWTLRVRQRVLDEIGRRSSEDRRSAIARLEDAVAAEPIALDSNTLELALGGNHAALVDLSTSSVIQRFRSLPADVQRRIGDPARFREEMVPLLNAQVPPFLDEVERRLAAQQALRSRVQVEVRSDVLAERPIQAIQEIQATLTQDDIEEVIDLPNRRS
jgi:hypothetical protein